MNTWNNSCKLSELEIKTISVFNTLDVMSAT